MFCDVARTYLGQKVAVLCARYQYRGILSEVHEDCLILANATAVERSGANNLQAPQQEDPINGSIVLKNDAMELLYQPPWVHAPLPGEDVS